MSKPNVKSCPLASCRAPGRQYIDTSFGEGTQMALCSNPDCPLSLHHLPVEVWNKWSTLLEALESIDKCLARWSLEGRRRRKRGQIEKPWVPLAQDIRSILTDARKRIENEGES